MIKVENVSKAFGNFVALDDELLEAETTRQRHAELQLAAGQRILVWPRQARFFLEHSWLGTRPDEESEAPGQACCPDRLMQIRDLRSRRRDVHRRADSDH